MVKPTPLFELNQLVGYQCRTFRVVGPYPDDSRLAAGVDILNRRRTRSELYDQILRWSALANVVYEGLLISNEVGRTVQQAQNTPTLVVFLDTPLEVCLERINQRRVAKAGGGSLFGEEGVEPVNPKNTTKKFAKLQRVEQRLIEAGVPTERLPWDKALARCQELLK